jgi:hypothetical protein
VYKRKNVTLANDFTEFQKGYAYWGRVDKNNDGSAANPFVNDNGGATNLVLGRTGNTAQSQLPLEYLDANGNSILTTGWNMISFDDVKPYIRRAATGLILTGVTDDDSLIITDDTGVNTITVTLTASGNGEDVDNEDAKLFNQTIESARLRNVIPESFHIKAFQGENAGTLILLSDKKFTVGATSGSISVKTLTQADPYKAGVRTAIADLDSEGPATSAYGEYMMMVDVLTGAGTDDGVDADNDGNPDGGVAKIRFGDFEHGDHSAITITTAGHSDLATAIGQIATAAPIAEPTFTPTVLGVDTNFDGTADEVLIAEEDPFYIRDNTFTRAFTLDTTNANGSLAFHVVGDTTVAIAPASGDSIDTVAGLINAQKGTTSVYGIKDSVGSKLISFTTADSTYDLKDVASGSIDFLKSTSSVADVAKGAIKDVFAIDDLAKKPLIQHDWKITNFTDPDENGDGVTVSFNGSDDVIFSSASPTTAEKKTFFDTLVSTINTQLVAANMHGYAVHNYEEVLDNYTNTIINIVGVDVDTISLADKDGGGGNGGAYENATQTDENAATVNTLGTLRGTLSEDLKFNAIYTPNFANYGPLYTLYDAGFDVKAILRASTKFADSTIAWDSIDITRNEADWFKNNEFNLFDVNLKTGYWVYLAPKTDNGIVIATPTYTPVYSYHFDADTKVTTNDIVGGQFQVNVEGLSNVTDSLMGTSSNVYVIVGGEEIQMHHVAGTLYSADITKYSSIDFKEDANPISMGIRATDGKGKAMKVADALVFDYAKPAAPVVSMNSINTITLTSTSQDVARYYIFEDYIPEIAPDASIKDGTFATAGVGEETTICAKYPFATQATLRVVAVDGTGAIGHANISDATEFTYISLANNARVLSDEGGDSTKASTPVAYDTSCTLEAVQPANGENDGISLKNLDSTPSVARLSYQKEADVSFDTDVPWTAIYGTPAESTMVQIQSVAAYAGKPFILEYGGKLYSGNFPISSDEADGSVTTSLPLTELSGISATLAQ